MENKRRVAEDSSQEVWRQKWRPLQEQEQQREACCSLWNLNKRGKLRKERAENTEGKYQNQGKATQLWLSHNEAEHTKGKNRNKSRTAEGAWNPNHAGIVHEGKNPLIKSTTTSQREPRAPQESQARDWMPTCASRKSKLRMKTKSSEAEDCGRRRSWYSRRCAELRSTARSKDIEKMGRTAYSSTEQRGPKMLTGHQRGPWSKHLMAQANIQASWVKCKERCVSGRGLTHR